MSAAPRAAGVDARDRQQPAAKRASELALLHGVDGQLGVWRRRKPAARSTGRSCSASSPRCWSVALRVAVRWPRVPTVRSAVQNVHAEWLASNLMLDKAPSKRTMRSWFDQYIGKGTLTTSRPGPRETWCVRALCFTALVPCQNSTQHKKKNCYCYSLRPHPRSHRFLKNNHALDVLQTSQWPTTVSCNISTEST